MAGTWGPGQLLPTVRANYWAPGSAWLKVRAGGLCTLQRRTPWHSPFREEVSHRAQSPHPPFCSPGRKGAGRWAREGQAQWWLAGARHPQEALQLAGRAGYGAVLPTQEHLCGVEQNPEATEGHLEPSWAAGLTKESGVALGRPSWKDWSPFWDLDYRRTESNRNTATQVTALFLGETSQFSHSI